VSPLKLTSIKCIPRSGISVDAEGGGVIGLTAAQLEAQVEAAQPAR